MNWSFLQGKDPEEHRDFVVDYGDVNITTISWTVDPDGSLEVTSDSDQGGGATVWLDGGEEGRVYEVKHIYEVPAGGAQRRMVRRYLMPVGNVARNPSALDDRFAAYRILLFMRDHAEMNTLLMNEREFDAHEVVAAAEDALMDWNATPPLTNHTFKSFPPQGRGLLYLRGAIYLLRSAANSQARNQVQYQDQGFSVVENDKAGIYLQMAAQMEQEYDLKKRRLKTARNMDSMWGGVHHDSFEDPWGYADDVSGERPGYGDWA